MTVPHIVKDAIGTACSRNNIDLPREEWGLVENTMEIWALYNRVNDLSEVDFDTLVKLATASITFLRT